MAIISMEIENYQYGKKQVGKNVPDVSGENRIFASDMKELYVRFYAKGRTSYWIARDGTVMSTADPESDPSTWRRIATYNGKGYRRIRLQGKTFKVHRLVAEAFVPNPHDLPNVLHKDGDRENNHYTNLEWSDKQSNHPIKK